MRSLRAQPPGRGDALNKSNISFLNKRKAKMSLGTKGGRESKPSEGGYEVSGATNKVVHLVHPTRLKIEE